MSPLGSSVPVRSASDAPQPTSDDSATRVDANDRETIGVGILLDDLVSDPLQRPLQIVALQHDFVVHSLASFLASQDRVKGRRERSSEGGGSGVASPSRTAGRFRSRPYRTRLVSLAPLGWSSG